MLMGIEDRLFTFITMLYLAFGFGGIVFAMALESCCLPVPSELVMPFAGFLVFSQPALFGAGWGGVIWIGIAGAVGCLVGSVVAYWIGATGGHAVVLKYGKYILISHRDFNRADAYFKRHGDAIVFFSRLLPVIRTYISLPAGISKVNFVKFMIYTLLGSLPWCIALGAVGFLLGDRWRQIGTYLRGFDILIILLIIAGIAWYVYHHFKEQRTGALEG